MTPIENRDVAIAKALERLDEVESKHANGNRKANRWLVIALTTALGGAGGTGAKAFVDASNVDQLREVVATHVAEANARQEQASKERDRLIDQVAALRETTAGLKAIVEILARQRSETRERIESIEVPPPIEKPHKTSAPKPPRSSIQAVRKDLFGD